MSRPQDCMIHSIWNKLQQNMPNKQNMHSAPGVLTLYPVPWTLWTCLVSAMQSRYSFCLGMHNMSSHVEMDSLLQCLFLNIIINSKCILTRKWFKNNIARIWIWGVIC
jgi:hypothetical protein